MKSSSSKCFVDALNPRRSSGIQVPLFLVSRNYEKPTVKSSFYQDPSFSCSGQKASITTATASNASYRQFQYPFPEPRFNPRTPTKTDYLASLPSNKDSSAYIKLLEPFLPPELRHFKPTIVGSRDSCIVNPINGLPLLLQYARSNAHHDIDLLSYLGVHQGRWEAVLWLVKAFLQSHKSYADAIKQLDRLHAPQWAGFPQLLDEITSRDVWADDLVQPLSDTTLNLDALVQRDESLAPDIELGTYHQGIGQMWQSVAHMLLQAAEYSLDDPTCELILSNVFQILAHIHHADALPSLIYQHSPPKDPFVPSRPPTLEILSSRIMAILSDSEWRVHNGNVVPKATHNVAENAYNKHSKSRATLQGQELGVGVWVDLLLWVCIEGGWLKEAAWIVHEIDKQNQNLDSSSKWSVIKWDSILKLVPPKSTWSTRLEETIVKSRMSEVLGGVAMTNHSENAFFRDIIPRCISQEAVMVLMDGLVTCHTCNEMDDDSFKCLQLGISACKRLLATEGTGLDPSITNSITLRLINSQVSDTICAPKMLEEIMQLFATSGDGEVTSVPISSSEISLLDLAKSSSALKLGILHQMLYGFAEIDNIQGALKTFKSLQELYDQERQAIIGNFIEKVQQSRLYPTENLAMDEVKANFNASLHQNPIPQYALAAFLDFVTGAELWEMAKWIIHSVDADGPTVSPDLYLEPSFQPSLIHFATATSDTKLLAEVSEQLRTPLSHANLQALLHCQINAGNWDSVEDVLSYFRDDPNMRWDSSDVMRIATAALNMERDISKVGSSMSASLARVITILQKLLSGDYNCKRGPFQGRDKSQLLLMNQLGRILLDVPGRLSYLILPCSISDKRVKLHANVSTDAFNILLMGVVECYGSMAGKKLWARWCQDNKVNVRHFSKTQTFGSGPGSVVNPNLRTLRIIMQPLVRSQMLNGKKGKKARATETDMCKNNQPSQEVATESQAMFAANGEEMKGLPISEGGPSLLEWGVQMYKNFGLTDSEIELEIPEDLYQRRNDS